ncbi:NB-ARC domain-containing protein [Heracleum sosnowskyi]|uniref:NB-ARC domain-containing protein n=1 Tax=Heracleum sosnowskyi TaxID=360622 RepID=A0AAD8JBH0_9APIA|nr:NB-ARC domain-containing protein [Heracleum sosnowskyi]
MRKAAIPRGMSNIDTLFDHMLLQLHMLLNYNKWLPVERRQLTFYSKKLSSLSEEFQSLEIKCEDFLSEFLKDRTLNVLVNKIIKCKNARRSVDCNKYSDPPDLTLVGDRLALQVALIYDATKKDFGNAEECGLEDFPTQFYFDKDKFQEGEVGFQFHFDKNKFQEREIFEGFQTEASNLLQQLACHTKKHLQVISIVGMAGLGKTTLATRLYNDPYVVSYFYVRAWVTCSQVYQKRDLLLSILRSVSEITDEDCRMNDTVLAHALYRALKGWRYLIVIDDIWSNKTWDDLKRCFPNDNNGSKIMLTTRLKDVALHAQPEGDPLCLRFLTEEESLALLRAKAFITETFFDYLSLTGNSIAKKCREGLIHQGGMQKSLEDVAEDYLMDLIWRSLIVVDCCCSSEVTCSFLKDVAITWDASNLIRALDISSIEFSGENLVNFSNTEEPGLLENLQTLSLVSPTRSCRHILARSRNLKKLGLCGPLTTKSGDLKFPDLGLLTGSPEAFPRLMYLKLDELDLENWNASRYHFPLLQRLQVCRCPKLMEIPKDFGNICTLEWIELSGCSDAAVNSAREILKEQESYGNDWLKIIVDPGLIHNQTDAQKGRSDYRTLLANCL